MSRLLRVVASLAIAVTAGWAVYRLCYLRFVCNVREMQSERAVIKLFNINDQVTARIIARQTVEAMDRCVPCSPTDVNQLMIRAAALRMLGRPAEAALDYRRALRVDRRAELFLNLGQAEMEAGRNDAAADALATAAFLFYTYLGDYPEPMQSRVRAMINTTYGMIMERRATDDITRQLYERVARDPL